VAREPGNLVGVELVLEVHLEQLGAVRLDTGALAADLRGEDKVVEDVLLHNRQGAVVWAQLLVLEARSGLLGDNSSLPTSGRSGRRKHTPEQEQQRAFQRTSSRAPGSDPSP
jgi:hypothetical protein